jgi:hypothetical protein
MILAACLLALPLGAQTEEQTLFKKATAVGGFGGPTFSYGKIAGRHGYGAGGGGGVVLDNFFLGAHGQSEMFDIQGLNPNFGTLALGYGGLWLGYTAPTRKAVHLFGSLKVGGGAVGYSSGRWWDDFDDTEFDDFDDVIFVLTPEAGVELNLFHWFRLAGTVGYRFVDGYRGVPGLRQQDLNAPVWGLTMRFGWFGHRRGVALR